jgi:hydrogenase expression/formation protein HypC
MCLGIPMQVVAVDGFCARCVAQGATRDVSLFMLQDAGIAAGDFVMVHLGYAIEKMTAQEARATWDLYGEALERLRAEA